MSESGEELSPEEQAAKAAAILERMHEFSDEKLAGIIGLLVLQIRPALADIFMAARSAIELADETGDGGKVKMDARGRMWFSGLLGLVQFSMVQEMVGEAHASSLLFLVDGIFRQIGDSPQVKRSREGGKVIGGYKLTQLLRTATNYLRHKHTWETDGNTDENEMLRALGVESKDENPATKVLKAIGIGTYMEFEHEIANAFAELLVGRPINVPSSLRRGTLLLSRTSASS